MQRSIPLRAGSEAPPESWWQSQAQYIDNSLSLCLMDAGSCLVWMQDLNNDGVPEVLLYNRNRPGITVYTRRGEDWRYAGNVTLSKSADKAIREAMPKAVIKPGEIWRLTVSAIRYSIMVLTINRAFLAQPAPVTSARR